VKIQHKLPPVSSFVKQIILTTMVNKSMILSLSDSIKIFEMQKIEPFY